MVDRTLHNAHLDGRPFAWNGGETGVLLLHGFTASPVEVRMLGERLHKLGYTVAGPLLPGHGTVPDDLNRVRWQEWTQAAEDAYRDLTGRCARVFVAGSSMGGLLALYLAAGHPEIRGVLLYAPAILLRLAPVQEALLPLVSRFAPFRPKPGLDEDDRWQGYHVDPLRGAVQLLRLQREVRRRLPEIEQPVQVVQGGKDTTVDTRVGEIILAGVRSEVKELHWMERSRHVVPLGPDLDEVVALAQRFIQETSD